MYVCFFKLKCLILCTAKEHPVKISCDQDGYTSVEMWWNGKAFVFIKIKL